MSPGRTLALTPRSISPPRFRVLLLLLAALIAPPAMAEGADNPIFGVTTINVQPRDVGKSVELLNAYRDAALKQSGNTEVTLLQEISRPTNFVVYEAWNDQAAYDANEKSGQVAKLRENLAAIEGSIDRRDYHVISIDKARPTSPSSFYVVLHLDVFPPGLDATLEAARDVAKASREQRTNIRYDVTESVMPPTSHSNLLSAWTNREAYDRYQNSTYARRFRDTVGPLLGSPFDERLYAKIK